MTDRSAVEPTVVAAAWRYRRIVLAVVVLVTLIGLAVVLASPPRYEAEATLLVEDPRTSSLFDSGVIARPERYVSNQATILTSAALAERASEIAFTDGVGVSPITIVEDLRVSFNEDSDEITVSFEADDPTGAIVVANSVARAYEEIRENTASRSFDRAIDELGDSIATLEDRLTTVGEEIDAILFANPARAVLAEQYQTALLRLADLQAQITNATGIELDALRAALDDVEQQLQTYQSLLNLESTSPDLAALFAEREQIAGRIADLSATRDRLEVDSSLGPTGIVLFSPALEAEEAGVPLVQLVLVSLLVGGVMGTALAYFLALRNRVFTERSQPEPVLRAPLLAAVPDFREEKIGNLPVKYSPTSSSAEAFRFAVTALQRAASASRTDSEGPDAGPSQARSFVVVSAAAGDGKSVIVANLALAAALQQMEVLVIDADFGEQTVARLLNSLPGPEDRTEVSGLPGLTDLFEGKISLRDAVSTIKTDRFPDFDLLSRGTAPVTAPEFFGKGIVRRFFRDVRDHYDIVLIDTPPLLQVAYASSLAHLGDRSIVVVPHGSSVGRAEELADRLEFASSTLLGYIYTKAPMRLDLPVSEGSMRDILGRGVPIHVSRSS